MFSVNNQIGKIRGAIEGSRLRLMRRRGGGRRGDEGQGGNGGKWAGIGAAGGGADLGCTTRPSPRTACARRSASDRESHLTRASASV